MGKETDLEAALASLPVEVLEHLTEEQRAALWTAVKPVSWKKQPVNIRFTFPLGSRRYFVTLVSGYERRSTDRLARERLVHPIRTMGNILFMLGVGGAFYLAAVAGIVVFSNLIEF
jgi:hypothetical protein